MLRKSFLLVAACACAFTEVVSAQDLKSLLSGVAKTVVGDQATTAASVVGTWTFSGPDCRFESDNLLAKAGGEAASSQVEKKLESTYEKLGLDGSTFTFGADSTYTLSLGSRTASGTYGFDSEAKTVTMRTKLGISVKAHVVVAGSSMSLLFNADKLMSALKALTSLTSQTSSAASAVNSLADNYDGLQLGFELEKKQ